MLCPVTTRSKPCAKSVRLTNLYSCTTPFTCRGIVCKRKGEALAEARAIRIIALCTGYEVGFKVFGMATVENVQVTLVLRWPKLYVAMTTRNFARVSMKLSTSQLTELFPTTDIDVYSSTHEEVIFRTPLPFSSISPLDLSRFIKSPVAKPAQ